MDAKERAAFCMGIGWAYGEACVQADKGEDIRKSNVPELLERAFKDCYPEFGKDNG